MEDLIDPIYLEKNPIKTSIEYRIKQGGHAQAHFIKVDPEPRFYFTLKLKGAGCQPKK